MGLRDVARQRQHHCDGVLRGGDGVAGRGVNDWYTPVRGCVHVDVVHAHARTADDLKAPAGVHHVRRHPGLAAHHQRIVLSDDGQQLRGIHAELDVNLTLGTEKLQTLRGQWVGDEHPGHQAPLAGEATGWNPTLGSAEASASSTSVISSSVM